MARIRTIKPAFFRHANLFDAEKETGLPLRVAYAGLWTACDREGRFEWKPRELKLDALPFDEVDFSRVLNALASRGHIVRYVVDGQAYGVIPSWHDHQVINNREAPSVLPEPTEESIESTTSTREARVDDVQPTPLMHAQVEGKGREGKGKGRREARDTRALPRPDIVAVQIWEDWIALRKAKKAPVTATVLDSATTEAGKAGMSLEAFLAIWCARGSQGLQADWLKPSERQPSQTGETPWQRSQRERVAEMTGGLVSRKAPGTTPVLKAVEVIDAHPATRFMG